MWDCSAPEAGKRSIRRLCAFFHRAFTDACTRQTATKLAAVGRVHACGPLSVTHSRLFRMNLLRINSKSNLHDRLMLRGGPPPIHLPLLPAWYAAAWRLMAALAMGVCGSPGGGGKWLCSPPLRSTLMSRMALALPPTKDADTGIAHACSDLHCVTPCAPSLLARGESAGPFCSRSCRRRVRNRPFAPV